MFAKTILSAVNRSGVICTRMMATEGKIQGKVKFFDVTKGFGFIAPNDGSGDCFVHQTAIVTDGFRSLAEGEDVEYDIVIDSNKGDKKSAANVTGPDGGNVIGTPRRDAAPRSRRDDNDDRY